MRLWDVEAGKEIAQFKGHKEAVTAVFFLPDGKSAISTGMDSAAIVWNLEDGKEVRRMTHTGGIYGAALSNNGKRLLTAGFGDKTMRLWEVASSRQGGEFIKMIKAAGPAAAFSWAATTARIRPEFGHLTRLTGISTS